MIRKFICHKCGAVNQIDTTQLDEPSAKSSSDWLSCEEPDGFEWKLPAGKITPVWPLEPIYITATGGHLSREEYIEKYGLDPEIALTMMRGMGGALNDSLKTTQTLLEDDDSKMPKSIKNLLSRLNKTQTGT